METNVVKFSGANIACVNDGNTIWVAIKSVCEAIGLDSDRAIKTITDDEILGAERSEQTVQLPNSTIGNSSERSENLLSQGRKMICLPIDFINGWLFQIKITNTMSEDTKQKLLTYKRECYRVLANHFFGNMRHQIEVNTMEISLLEEINQLNEQKNELTNTLRQKKGKLEKIRELRLQPDPELDFK